MMQRATTLLRQVLLGPLVTVLNSLIYPAYRAYIKSGCSLLELWERRSHQRFRSWHVPPPLLRFRVTETTNVNSFFRVGEQIANDLLQALEYAGIRMISLNRILDFGCGCGRTLTWLVTRFPDKEFFGTDVDLPAIEWCRAHIGGARFSTNEALPPTGYENATFDLVYAVSVFTHLDEDMQLQWLQEFRRVLKRAGVVVLTLHGEATWERLSRAEMLRIKNEGFVFQRSSKLKGIMPEWYHTAYHSQPYVMKRFGELFDIVEYLPQDMGYQDVVVMLRK